VIGVLDDGILTVGDRIASNSDCCDVDSVLVADGRAYDRVSVENAASFGCSMSFQGFRHGLEEVLDVYSVDSPGDGQNNGGPVDYSSRRRSRRGVRAGTFCLTY
jgi:hypothetical protein